MSLKPVLDSLKAAQTPVQILDYVCPCTENLPQGLEHSPVVSLDQSVASRGPTPAQHDEVPLHVIARMLGDVVEG